MAVENLGKGAPDGLQMGLSDDKIGFYGTTTIAQATVAATTTTTATTTALQTDIDAIRTALQNLGLIA
jgi:hypothetical protein|tara:strand:+ start:134 stop:337 length:204 start_codon:yes stop_codon:yes gene_type:complete